MPKTSGEKISQKQYPRAYNCPSYSVCVEVSSPTFERLPVFDDQLESLFCPHHLRMSEPTGMRALAPCPWQAGGSRMVMDSAQGEP